MVRGNNPKAARAWVALESGRVTASGAPGRARLAEWAREGVTDVVTLQRADEHAAWLPDGCAQAGLIWHHLPLSGRRLERKQDRESLARVPELLQVLRREPPRTMIVHCSAGLHRTGVCLYLLMRAAGLSGDEAVAKIAAARPLTAQELSKQGKRGSLRDKAEEIFREGRADPG